MNISAIYLQLLQLLTSTQIWVQWLGFDKHHSKQLDQSPRINIDVNESCYSEMQTKHEIVKSYQNMTKYEDVCLIRGQ